MVRGDIVKNGNRPFLDDGTRRRQCARAHIYRIGRKRDKYIKSVQYIFSTRSNDRKIEIERERNSHRRRHRHNKRLHAAVAAFSRILYYYYCTSGVCTCVNRYGAPSGRGAPVQRDRRDDFDDTVPPPTPDRLPFIRFLFLCGYIHTTTTTPTTTTAVNGS